MSFAEVSTGVIDRFQLRNSQIDALSAAWSIPIGARVACSKGMRSG